MHKKLAADLTSLAHSILQMKNKEDVFALKAKAHDVYEKLALLAYVEEYINNTPNVTTTKEELIATLTDIENKPKIENTSTKAIETKEELIDSGITVEKTIVEEPTVSKNDITIESTTNEELSFTEKEAFEKLSEQVFTKEPEPIIEDTSKNSIEEEVLEQPFDELERILFGDDTIKDEASFIEETKTPSNQVKLEIVQDEIVPIIEETEAPIEEKQLKIVEEKTIPTEEIKKEITESIEPTLEKEKEITSLKEPKQPTLEEELGDTISVDVMANLFEKAPPKTLNDKLFQNTIKIDLNDRIAFVKHLFEGNQEDFNRVISQLNTMKTEKGAKQFILKMIKPDYDWSEKEAYETRLLEIIERRFS